MQRNTQALVLTTLMLLNGCGGETEEKNTDIQTLAHFSNAGNKMQVESKSNKDVSKDLKRNGINIITLGASRHNLYKNKWRTAGGYLLVVPALTGSALYDIGLIAQAIGNSTCMPGHPKYDAGLCYKRCKSGYTGVGPVCWKKCKDGQHDDGAFCRDKLHTKMTCGKCGHGYKRTFACTCSKGGGVHKKDKHNRGEGIIPPKCAFFRDKFSCDNSSLGQCIYSNITGKGACFKKHNKNPIMCPKVIKKISKSRSIYLRQCYSLLEE